MRTPWLLALVMGSVPAGALAQKPDLTESLPICVAEADTDTSAKPMSPGAKRITLLRTYADEFMRSTRIIAEPSTVSTSAGLLIGSGQSAFSPFENTVNVDPGRDRKPYVLNADIRPVIAIGGKRFSLGSSRWQDPVFVAFQLIPHFKVRILANDPARGDGSLPVRTPSYLPGGELFLTDLRHWNSDLRTRKFLSFKVHHHSNGQDRDGGEFRNGYFNTRNGDYSETLVYKLSIGLLTTDWGGTEKAVLEHDTTGGPPSFNRARVNRSFRPHAWTIGISHSPHMTDSLKPFFGNTVLHTGLTLMFAPYSRDLVWDEVSRCYRPDGEFEPHERFRLDVRLSYILDEEQAFQRGPYQRPTNIPWYDATHRMNLYETLYYVLPTVNTTAVFAQFGYYGSDPYNAFFQEQQLFWRIGIALGDFIHGEPFVRPALPTRE